jgi:uncharacterized protein with HEPN domain
VKDDRIYLQHIRDAISRIVSYTAGGRDAFLVSPQAQDAVIRQLEIIGEAVKHLSAELRQQHPDIPWKRIAGMRDEMIHEYFGVDLTIVWNVIEQHIPPLSQKVDSLLGEV